MEQNGNPFKITEQNLKLNKLTDLDLILFYVHYILILVSLVLAAFSEKYSGNPDLSVDKI